MKAVNATRRRFDDIDELDRESRETTAMLFMGATVCRVMGTMVGSNPNVSTEQHEDIEVGLQYVLEMCVAKVNRIQALANAINSGEKGGA